MNRYLVYLLVGLAYFILRPIVRRTIGIILKKGPFVPLLSIYKPPTAEWVENMEAECGNLQITDHPGRERVVHSISDAGTVILKAIDIIKHRKITYRLLSATVSAWTIISWPIELLTDVNDGIRYIFRD